MVSAGAQAPLTREAVSAMAGGEVGGGPSLIPTRARAPFRAQVHVSEAHTCPAHHPGAPGQGWSPAGNCRR